MVDKVNHQIYNGKIDLKTIYKAERLALKTKNAVDLLRVYKLKVLFYYYNKDYYNGKPYIAKIEKLLPYCEDPLEKADTYQTLFVVDAYPPDENKANLLKAFELYKKYGQAEDQIDINYNLAICYNRENDSKNAIMHSLLALEAIDETHTKSEMKKYLYLFLFEAYTELNEFTKAKEMLNLIDSIAGKLKQANHFTFTYLLQKNTSKFYYKTKQYKKLAEINDQVFASIDSVRKMDLMKLNDALSVESELKIKNKELEHLKIKQQLENRNEQIFIIFISLLLILFIIISIFLKRNSREVNAINQELELKNKDLAAMTTELGDALKAKTEFLNLMTHELFTPINGISIISQNLKTETDKKSFDENIELLEFSSNHLYRLLKNIVDAKFIEKQVLILKPEAVNFQSFMGSVAQTANFFLKTSTNKFKYFIDANIPDPLLVDSVKLSQILLNLLNNANKFTANGLVSLQVNLEVETATKAKISFKVTDTGIGIDAAILERIFDKFSHGSDEIKEKFGGSGIGLYIVKHFLLLQDSEITVESQKGNTVFSFSIWFDKAFEMGKSDKTVTQKSKGEILLVDDNRINLILTKKLLESNGFVCDTIESGFDALELLRKKNYDLILMDIMMPGLNGFETIKKIREENITDPIIALTAIDIDQNTTEFEQADFTAVLSKPLVHDCFFKTITAILAKNSHRS
ncbi:response regulator [Pedobacter endophyticus]|uniref:histidine kinase n=1 Tax=Pedobacter endophyticus TaxID=2789740 RepID=A0A7U3Q3X8_9SPHI|nr:response regulator [Pedobacter endophyticus]QPH38139.1 response regulator [Pedobacter endophyticus]